MQGEERGGAIALDADGYEVAIAKRALIPVAVDVSFRYGRTFPHCPELPAGGLVFVLYADFFSADLGAVTVPAWFTAGGAIFFRAG